MFLMVGVRSMHSFQDKEYLKEEKIMVGWIEDEAWISNWKLIKTLYLREINVDNMIDKTSAKEVYNNGMNNILNKVIKLLSCAHAMIK